VIDSPIAAVILEGTRHKQTAIEGMVRRIRHSSILDNFLKLENSTAVKEKILATNDRGLADLAGGYGVTIHWCDIEDDFHFGRHLASLINSHHLSRIFYLGGGAAPFLTIEEIREICAILAGRENVLMANNFFSSDFVAFTPADVVNRLTMPRTDNALAYVLREEGGLDYIPLSSSCGTVFDIDTPTDVMILSLCSGLGPSTEKAIGSIGLEVQPLKDIIAAMMDRKAEILIFGRLNPHIFGRLESQVKSRLRVFTEERGMKARGRIERGEVRSFIGDFLEEVGVERFFEKIARLCDGAFIDSRVIFAHMQKKVSKQDRFLSDYGDYEAIGDDFVREFTRQAKKSSIPVILGGHSLLSGGLWILGDIVERTLKAGEGGGVCRSSVNTAREKVS
jgi:hypothetical protein